VVVDVEAVAEEDSVVDSEADVVVEDTEDPSPVDMEADTNKEVVDTEVKVATNNVAMEDKEAATAPAKEATEEGTVDKAVTVKEAITTVTIE
jgi:hypothetical protein